MKALRFTVVTLLCLFALLYLFLISYVYFNQVDMIFMASKLPENHSFKYERDFEEITIPTFDKFNLNGLLFKASHSKGLVFYLHGNAGNLETWGNISENYTRLGYDIFILDYRGFGKSEGEIENEEQFLKDVTAAYNKMRARYDEQRIIVIGYSIGTGPATYLASKNHPKALILQAPYYNFSDFSDLTVPFIPDFIKKFTFETNLMVPGVSAPIYIFHGNNDRLIPISNSERLSKIAKIYR